MSTQFSVIICAYTEERWEELLSAVESVKNQTVPSGEIIVVIDHNHRLFERASKQIAGIRIIQNVKAQGLSGARNSGIKAAQFDLVAFMDEDARADPRWLEILSDPFQDRHVMGAGGSILPYWVSGRPAWFPEEFNWVVGCTYRGMGEVRGPIRNLIGCNMAFRRDILVASGGFRSGIGRYGALPFGCEETELCIRASSKFAGVFILEPASRVVHRIPPARARFSYFCSRCYAEGQSKALVTRYVGIQNGLRSERAYAFKTLPSGVINGIADSMKTGKSHGLQRAGAIITGLAITTWGFLVGKASLLKTASLQVRENQAEYQLNE